MDLTPMEEFLRHVDFGNSSFWIAVIAIIFNPLFWNLVRTTADHTVDTVFKNQALVRISIQHWCLHVARLWELIRTTVWLSEILIWSGFGFFFSLFLFGHSKHKQNSWYCCCCGVISRLVGSQWMTSLHYWPLLVEHSWWIGMVPPEALPCWAYSVFSKKWRKDRTIFIKADCLNSVPGADKTTSLSITGSR